MAEKVGSYRVLFELATGGMGVVELALHRAAGGFERLVVVKRIHRHLLASREIVDMLVDEARLASQIRHPNVVPVDDVVESGGELLLVQPYVESVTLSALIDGAAAAGEVLEAPVVSRILSDVLAGLGAAHRAVDLRGQPLEIVHRDVSPHNVLVGVDGCSRVIDFGIAKAARRITVTEAGTLKGKIGYMAPEQLRRVPVDARADVFSSGVVLYEALTGTRPFEGADEGDTLLSILMGEPPAPSTKVPALSADVDAVVAQALATDRGDRYASADDMREALERAAAPAPARDVARVVQRWCAEDLAALHVRVQEALGARASSAPAAPGASGPLEEEQPIAGRTAAEPPPRSTSWQLVAAVAVPAAAALAAGLAWSRSSPRADPPRLDPAATTADAGATQPVTAVSPAPPPSAPAPVPSASAPVDGARTTREPTRSMPRPKPDPTVRAAPASSSELHPSPYSRAP